VLREKPCRGTDAGVTLLWLAAQMAMLESEALAETGGGGSGARTRIAMAVNADSMSKWFTAVCSVTGRQTVMRSRPRGVLLRRRSGNALSRYAQRPRRSPRRVRAGAVGAATPPRADLHGGVT
jgi:hypothetical protein